MRFPYEEYSKMKSLESSEKKQPENVSEDSVFSSISEDQTEPEEVSEIVT